MSNIIRITKEFSFEASHALEGYDGLCSQIHGHSYRFFVTVKGTPCSDPSNPKLGMVMDFGNLKQIVKTLIVDKYDHAFVIRETDSNRKFLDTAREKYDRLIVTPFQPTCENLLAEFAVILRPALPQGICLHSMKLHETATSFAEWYAEDN